MHRPALLWFVSLCVPLLAGPGLGCQAAVFDDAGDPADGGNTTSGDGDGDANQPSGDGDGSPSDNGPTFNCNPDVDGSCADGQKCTVLTSGSGIVYECVTDDTEKLAFEACTPAPATGQDGCPSNHSCIAPLESSNGHCLPLCSSDAGCDSGLCAAPPGLKLLVCAAICDPLAPFCPDLQACQRVRQSSFVCQYPAATDTGTTGTGCNASLDAGCAEGFVCETGGIIPGCAELSCCTALCDLSDTDPCVAPMICGELPLDPQPGLGDVGACYVPQ